MKRRIAILGSTGSIGTQALEVIEQHRDIFEVTLLTANSNSDLLIRQAAAYKPDTVVIADEQQYQKVFTALNDLDIKVYSGADSLSQVMEMDTFDIVLIAMVGISGLKPAIAAINSGKAIALANKEILVVAGQLLSDLAKQRKVSIIPVDSEHSAIMQCLLGERSEIEKLYITASGGPLRGMSKSDMEKVTIQQALAHPNWEMGKKISIDSATMMNKGFEVIEARWLFEIDPSKIEILIHPQSIVHSMVQFRDGSIKAQMSETDMKIPIQFALSFPYRLPSDFKRINFMTNNSLSFEAPDKDQFPCLELAYTALKMGGNMPCVINAANEIAVTSFLNGEIKITEIPTIIQNCMDKIGHTHATDLNTILNSNSETRALAIKLCNHYAS